jgi:hypothetical protein
MLIARRGFRLCRGRQADLVARRRACRDKAPRLSIIGVKNGMHAG